MIALLRTRAVPERRYENRTISVGRIVCVFLMVLGCLTAIDAALIWSEGFETGLGAWTTSNVVINTTGQYVHSGSQSARMNVNIPNAYMWTSIDLSAYQGSVDMDLSFWWRENGNWEMSDSFWVEIYDGTWKTAFVHYEDENNFVQVNIDIDSLANMTSDFRIRFWFGWDNSGNAERPYVDDIEINGTAPVAPSLTGLGAAAFIAAAQNTDGSKTVNIDFEAADTEQDSVYITGDYRQGAGGWSPFTVAFLSGDSGRIDGNDANADRLLVWNVGSELPGIEASNYQVQLTANDEGGGPADSTTTTMQLANLQIDTQDPTGLANFAVSNPTTSSLDASWTSCTETNFNHYEVWYGTSKTDVSTRSGGAAEWDNSDDANLATRTTTSTTITDLNPDTKYYFQIWAMDDLGNTMDDGPDSSSTLPTPDPVVTGWDPYIPVVSAQVDSDTVQIGYEVSDLDNDSVDVIAQYRIGTGSWLALNTNIVGDTGRIKTSSTDNDTILWDVKTALGSDIDTTVEVRVIADDGSAQDTTSTGGFNVDTRLPSGLANFDHTDSTSSAVTFTWTACTETNFDHYEIWYGVNKTNVQNRSGASEWDQDNDAQLGTRTTATTIVSGLTSSTKYFFQIWAVDAYGYEMTDGPDSATTEDGALPWSDDFEAGLGNWSTNGITLNTNASNSNSPSNSARFDRTGSANMIVTLDLSPYQGASDISLQFYWKDGGGWEDADSMLVDIYDGSWQNVYTWFNDQNAFTEVNVDLDAVASMVSNFQVRFTFIWDGAGNQEYAYVDDVTITGTLPTPPTLTGLSAAEFISASQSTDGSKIVTIDFEVSDAEQSQVYMTADYRQGADAYQPPTLAYTGGDTGWISAASSTTDRAITWDVGQELPNTEATNYQVQLTANDGSDGLYDSTTTEMQSANLVIDTKAPENLGNLDTPDSTQTSITATWTVCTETNFDHYEIWYGTLLSSVENRTASEWDDSDDGTLGTISTATTTITGLNPSTKYYLKIWAVDAYGNDLGADPDSQETEPTPTPVVTGWDPDIELTIAQVDSDSVQIGFEVSDIDDDSTTVHAQYRIGTGSWLALNTNIVGDTGKIATSATANDTIMWDIKTAFGSDYDSTANVRVIATDGANHDTLVSPVFSIDTRDPKDLANFDCFDSTFSSVSCNWTIATESNFHHYEIWYGVDKTEVNNRGAASEWDHVDNATLATRTTNSTVVTGLSPTTKYFFRIWAVDNYSYEMQDGMDSCTTTDGALPWFDGFEAGLGNWTVNGVTIGTVSYEGSQSAEFDNEVGQWMELALDLSPYQGSKDINLRFYWRDAGGLEPTDSLVVDVFDGSWKQAFAHNDDQDAWTVVNVDLDDKATINASFKLRYRFVWDGSGGGERARVDSVYLFGTFPNSPTLTGLGGAANITASQKTDGSQELNIDFEAGDTEQDSVYITGDFRAGSGPWTPISLSYCTGDKGRLRADQPTVDRLLVWDAGAQLGEVEGSNYQIRLTANDEGGGYYDSTTTMTSDTNIVVDTRAPTGLGGFDAVKITLNSATLNWDAVSDANFSHYEIWYGQNQNDVRDRTGTAAEWDDVDDPDLDNLLVDSTTITGLITDNTYYFKIWAVDNFGNEDTVASISVYIRDMVTPVWSQSSFGTIQGGAIQPAILYMGSGTGKRLYAINLNSGGGRWNYSTASYGECRAPTYIQTDGTYKVLVTAGNYVIGRQDNGASSSQMFAPIDLGSTPGKPYASPDDSTFYVASTNKITKYKMSDGSQIGGWPKVVANISKEADLSVFNDVVYAATTNGKVISGDAEDFTPLSTYQINASTAISQPLLVISDTLYFTPENDTLYAINALNMSTTFYKLKLAASNTGPAFAVPDSPYVYVAAGSNVQRALTSGSIDWTYPAGGTVESGPIAFGDVVYFGRNGGEYYALDKDNGTLLHSLWPYTAVAGDANIGPWIDRTRGRVIFATGSGNLNSFTLE